MKGPVLGNRCMPRNSSYSKKERPITQSPKHLAPKINDRNVTDPIGTIYIESHLAIKELKQKTKRLHELQLQKCCWIQNCGPPVQLLYYFTGTLVSIKNVTVCKISRGNAAKCLDIGDRWPKYRDQAKFLQLPVLHI